MKTIELKADFRKEIGKSATRRLRKEKIVPGVLYGGEKVIHFKAPIKNFIHIIYTPNVYLVKLNIEEKTYNAVIQDIQFHPVNDALIHIDLYEVKDDKPVSISLPVEITGNAAGVKEGGLLHKSMRYLKVRGLIKDLPDTLKIDVTELGMKESIQVKELEFDNIELLNAPDSVVVAVRATRLTTGMAPLEEEEEAEEEEETEEKAEEKTEEKTEE